MKIKVLSLSVLIAFTSTSYASSWDARSIALAGTGAAGGDYSDVSNNPALGAIYNDNDDFYTSFGFGAYLADANDVIELGIDFAKSLDDLEKVKSKDTLDKTLNCFDQLAQKSGAISYIDAGVSFSVAIPSTKFGTSFVVDNNSTAALKYNIDREDKERLLNGKTSNLRSEIDAMGVSITDFGLNIANNYQGYNLGIMPKFQHVIAWSERISISNADDIDADDYATHGAFNVDIGVQKTIKEHWQVGFVGKNLIRKKYSTKTKGVSGDNQYTKVTISPAFTIGGAYKTESILVEANLDLTDGWELGSLEASKMARIGAELGGDNDWASIRVGYSVDLNDVRPNTISAGLGVKLFKSFGLDLAGQYSPDGGIGASINTNIEF